MVALQVLRKFGSTYFPLSAIRTWLDQHVSFRLSILFAYLFGKSELAVQLLKWLGAAGNIGRAMLEPLNIYLRSDLYHILKLATVGCHFEYMQIRDPDVSLLHAAHRS